MDKIQVHEAIYHVLNFYPNKANFMSNWGYLTVKQY